MSLLHEGTHNWRSACNKLGLTYEEDKELATLVKKRNKAIDREDNLMEQMREKQLRVIRDLDHSVIKESKVPPQMVLRRLPRDQDTCDTIAQCTNGGIAKIKTTRLLNAKASEVLAARQYLGRRGLPRSLAGEWGNGLVVIVGAEDDTDEPERFEWKEDLAVQRKRCKDDTIHTRRGVELPAELMALPADIVRDFIEELGEDTPVNPSNLLRHRMGHDPVRDFENNTPWWHSRHRAEPKHVSDAQASFQWKLDKAKREAEEARRALEKVPCREQGIPAENHTVEGLQEAVMEYDYDDTALFQFINLGGELVPTGIESMETGLFKDTI